VPFTDLSDLYGAVNEDGINLVVRHVMRKRPSLFNYGTQAVVNDPLLHCVRIDAAPEVVARGNPLMTREDPIEIMGTNGQYGLDFCAQLTEVRVDFHPGGAISLPPELAPLDAQHFAVSASACAGIGCPSDDVINRLPPVRPAPSKRDDDRPQPKLPPRAIPADRLNCFCLSLFLEGHFETTGAPTLPELQAKVDGVEIVDLAPQGLEDSIECYLRLVLQLAVLPQLTVAIQKLVLDVVEMLPTGVGIAVPIGTPAIPNNPAVEQDELRVRVNVTTGP